MNFLVHFTDVLEDVQICKDRVVIIFEVVLHALKDAIIEASIVVEQLLLKSHLLLGAF